jgi:hypothetical protein
MVDTCRARRNQASNIPRDGVIFDSSILLQFKSTLYKLIAGYKITSSTICGIWCFLLFHSPAIVVTVLGDIVVIMESLQNSMKTN